MASPPPGLTLASFQGCGARSPLVAVAGKGAVWAVGAHLVRYDDGDGKLHLVHSPGGIRGVVRCLAASSSGALVAAGYQGRDADVVVWDSKDTQLFRLGEHDHEVVAVAFSRDERLLVSCGGTEDNKVFIWDTKTGCIVCSAGLGQIGCVSAIQFGGISGRNYVLAIATDKGVSLWQADPYTGNLSGSTCAFGMTRRNFSCLSVASDNQHVYAGSTTGDVAIIGLQGKNLMHLVSVCAGGITSINEVKGQKLVIGGGDGKVHVLDPRNPKTEYAPVATLPSQVRVVAHDPAMNAVYALTNTCRIYKISLDTLEAKTILQSHLAGIASVAALPSNPDLFVTCSADRTVNLLSFDDAMVQSSVGVKGAGGGMSLAVWGSLVITGWSDGSIRCYDASEGLKEVWVVATAHQCEVSALAVAQSGHFFVSGDAAGSVMVWDINSRELVMDFKHHHAAVTGIVVTEDDSVAISCSQDKTFMAWNLIMQERISCHTQRMGGITGIVLAKDQIQVVTVGKDRKLSFWDLREPNPLQVIDDAHDETSTCIALSEDGQFIVTGGSDSSVRVWSFQTGQIVAEGTLHPSSITSVAFSADAKKITSADETGIVMVWNFAGLN